MLRESLRPESPHAFAMGIGLTLLGYFLFAVNDVVAKFMVTTFGVAQVLTIRAVGGLLILLPLAFIKDEKPFRSVNVPFVQALRATLITVDTSLFYAAVVYLSLADVMTFYMAGPIYMTVASRLVLGERAGWRRWSAVLLGFAGVLIALRPSSSTMSAPALLACLGGIASAVTVVLNRYLAGTKDTTLGIYQGIGSLVLAGAVAIFHWQPATPRELVGMLVLGFIGAVAHLVVTRSLKLAPVNVLAPFQYSLLLWGMIFGVVFFNDMPDIQMIVGAAIIVVAGVFISHRKAKKGEQVALSVDLP
ncbi:S-adenosylmethionine uptake transporter [Rhizobium sp. BK602]|nr:S-adenosylmethionine uptake transporter [Rhizobium sp. BK602]